MSESEPEPPSKLRAAALEASTATVNITLEALERMLLGDFILKVYLKLTFFISGQVPKRGLFKCLCRSGPRQT
jgi:hypothetical protein